MKPKEFIYFYRDHSEHPFAVDDPIAEETAWVILKDAKLATQLKRKDMAKLSLGQGKAIETHYLNSRDAANRAAFQMARKLGCKFVSPEELAEAERNA